MKKLAGQKGMALLEMMAAMAITTLVMGGAFSLIYQQIGGTDIAKTTVTAAHEITNAARRISQDGMMAENTDLSEGSPPVSYVTLSWIERHDFANIPHSCSYFLYGDELRRDYDDAETTVARHISKIKFSQSGRIITVSISCTPRWWVPEQTVEKSFRVYLRPTEEEMQ